jgi:imidazolonepropionase-like amidohydrolase
MNPLLIVHGQVFDGTGTPPAAADVLIVGDKIAAVGEEALARARHLDACQRFDAQGMTVMPGLIDAHCHISFDEVSSNDELFFHRRQSLAAIIAARNVRKLLTAGVTGFFDADSIFELGIDLRDAIEAGVVEGPRMTTGAYALLTSVGGTAGRLIPEEGVIGYGKVVRTMDEIRIEVRRQIKAGADWIKVHVTGLVPRQRAAGELQVWSADELKLVCDVAHDLGTPVVGHCRGARSVLSAVRAGFDLILHATGMDEAAMEAVISARIPIAPTLTFQANLADYGEAVGADPHLQEIFRREIADSAAGLRAVHQAGVPLLCGSESGFSLTPYGEWHHRELEVLVHHIGLTPLQALRCATLEGAHALRLGGRTGRIAAGQLADVIVIDGDPSRDVSLLGRRERLKLVVANGRAVDLALASPPRRSIPGWRVNAYGSILTQDKVPPALRP